MLKAPPQDFSPRPIASTATHKPVELCDPGDPPDQASVARAVAVGHDGWHNRALAIRPAPILSGQKATRHLAVKWPPVLGLTYA